MALLTAAEHTRHAYKHYATSEHPVGAQITIQEVMPNV